MSLRTFRRTLLVLALLFLGGMAALWYVARHANDVFPTVFDGRGEGLYWGKTPGELIRYAKKRLLGHPKLEFAALPVLDAIQRRYERPAPMILSDLGKGQRQVVEDMDLLADIHVSHAEDLAHAMRIARAGQTIELFPGEYEIHRRLDTGSAGAAASPITVRAARTGEVTLLSHVAETINVSQPYWIFENLDFKGVCEEDSTCDHAFHVVGKARNTILRNNRMVDFNAHIKINGENGAWPDDGLFQFNTLTNTRSRDTVHPVSFFDLVGASGWRVEDNLIARFIKQHSNQGSYGLFMKGGGQGGVIERNLIICTPEAISQPGVRVGISIGNGGTGKGMCRDEACRFEHRLARVVNNIVAHCNDSGIDIFKSSDILVAHNTLINTSGIDVRGAWSSARIYGNLFDGSLRNRHGAQVLQEKNGLGDTRKYFFDADALNLSWSGLRDPVGDMAGASHDFCGQERGLSGFLGASASLEGCLK
jgi:hypothetical protein